MAGVSQIVAPLTELVLKPDAVTADSVGYLPQQYTGQALEYTIYVVFRTGVTVGVVKVESSYSPDFTGVWPAEATVTFAGTAPNQQVVHLTALNQSIRVRVSTTVANGTMNVYYMIATRA